MGATHSLHDYEPLTPGTKKALKKYEKRPHSLIDSLVALVWDGEGSERRIRSDSPKANRPENRSNRPGCRQGIRALILRCAKLLERSIDDEVCQQYNWARVDAACEECRVGINRGEEKKARENTFSQGSKRSSSRWTNCRCWNSLTKFISFSVS